MGDFLDLLAKDATKTIQSGYYDEALYVTRKPVSLEEALSEASGNPVIAEIKAASPSKGVITRNLDPVNLAETMMSSGATAISVLTEPTHFHGSLNYLHRISETLQYPTLMKDVIISPLQVKAAKKMGAAAVLLIYTLYRRGYGDLSLDEMISYVHGEGLEVLLETHTVDEFEAASLTDADIVGINNRDLKTLEIDLSVTERILAEAGHPDKLVVSESGISSAQDIRYLRGCGADAFLVGSSIMATSNLGFKVRELVDA
jgi:indole-3-glycerol phosphate synthase